MTASRYTWSEAVKVRDAIRLVEAAGWRLVPGEDKGSHRKFRHPERRGIVIIPGHPNE
ncbi:MAG TPA: type II toxin-antitoxin system HicA family toxin, partial [Dehalococcoidia bacterium]|nr:type II toxin-antitoxin system HicA family toxin [Dehalococcoidia bacterium]